MKYKFIILLISIMLGSQAIANAQQYRNAVGIRGGYSSGFTYKHFIKRHYAMDIQALYNEHGFQFNGIYEYHFSPYDRRRLFYYAGAGAYTGNWDEKFAIGATASLGAEFILRGAPISLGAEWKPIVNFYNEPGYALFDLAIHVRVMIN